MIALPWFVLVSTGKPVAIYRLAAIAAGLVALGLAAFRRRDIPVT